MEFLSKNDAMIKEATTVHLAIDSAAKCITVTETVKEHCFLFAIGISLPTLVAIME